MFGGVPDFYEDIDVCRETVVRAFLPTSQKFDFVRSVLTCTEKALQQA
jgi:hypothetical protein